jgi:hypothetical protein
LYDSSTLSPNAPKGPIYANYRRVLKFDNDQSRKYFKQEIRDYGGGGKYLVAKSFYRGEQKAEDLEEDNVEICLYN